MEPVKMPARVLVAGLVTLGLVVGVSWSAYQAGGWNLGLGVFLTAVVVYMFTCSAVWWDIRTDGYELKKLADARGKRRWRVGLRVFDPITGSVAVQWVPPNSRRKSLMPGVLDDPEVEVRVDAAEPAHTLSRGDLYRSDHIYRQVREAQDGRRK